MWSVKAVEEKLQGKKVIRIWRERERERERMVGEREREDMKGEESRRITDPQNNKNKTASHLQSAHSRTNLCSSLDPSPHFTCFLAVPSLSPSPLFWYVGCVDMSNGRHPFSSLSLFFLFSLPLLIHFTTLQVTPPAISNQSSIIMD